MTIPKRLIIETDVYSDVDDIGALAVAHHYADAGVAELISIGVNTPSRYGYRAVRVVNDYFGREVPIGIRRPLDESVFETDYARFLWEAYGTGVDDSEPDDAVAVHRRALDASPDRSVTVVSIGFFDNLERLIDSSGDDASPLSGLELIRAKVERLVVMGGHFPAGHEFNIEQSPRSASRTLARWPTPVDFLGWEVGLPVITGRALSMRGDDDVVGAAYRRYSGAGNGRESWDPLTIRLAVLGAAPDLQYSPPGTVRIDENGGTSFQPSPDGAHRYVRLAAPPEAAASALDAVLERTPQWREKAVSNRLDLGRESVDI
ncbi:nucleoside hydrolase [Gryllotalpicola reticulitermitis]|uniref:Nucleoside hydrolase n=1 Tax=Gryllotalpicola reticulitermitis TaxID=1184153 RepID=A0ABV8Q4X5_9MICO